jgi:hypothetical protein
MNPMRGVHGKPGFRPGGVLYRANLDVSSIERRTYGRIKVTRQREIRRRTEFPGYGQPQYGAMAESHAGHTGLRRRVEAGSPDHTREQVGESTRGGRRRPQGR